MVQKIIKIINQKRIIANGIIITLVSLFLFASKVSADGWASPDKPDGVPENFDGAVLNLTNWVLGFVAMIAVLAIVWGGVIYIGSSGDETKATTGKRVITYAIIGMIIAGIAYALVNVIITEILVATPVVE